MDKKEVKTLLENIGGNWYILKLGSVEQLVAAGNSERYSNAIANNWAIIGDNTYRIYSKYNNHLKATLEAAGVDGWRVDGIGRDGVEYKKITGVRNWQAREYIVNIEDATAAPVLASFERVCKTCGRIVNKTELVGAYCLECLFTGNEDEALAKRFGYHCFYGDYKVYENIDTTKTPVFGVEIERDYLGGYSGDFDADLHEACLGACKALYNGLKKTSKRRAVFMRDGSLYNDGVEWITYPQSYKAYKKEREALSGALNNFSKYNFGASNSAGNHIHINKSYFGESRDAARFAAAKMAVILAESWEQWCAVVGRDIYRTGYTTKPSHTKNDSIFTIARKTIENEDAHSVAVNLQHNNTIELRLFGAVHNVDELLLYIDIAQALARFAKKKGLETCQRASVADICKYIEDAAHLVTINERLAAANFIEDAEHIEAIISKKTRGEV